MKIKAPKFKYENVLLIDDNELDNFINQKMIEANHFSGRIYTNTSAISAIEFLNNLLVMHPSPDKLWPEVIFIDINMPLIDGFQFVKQFNNAFRKNMPDTKLVILTSSVYHEDRVKAKEISTEMIFLNKPLNASALLGI